MLVAPYDLDTRAIDRFTGRLGYGHAAIFNGERAAGHWVGIDASFEEQRISRRYLYEIAKGSPWVMIPLSRPALAHTYRNAQRRLGQPYNNLGLAGVQRPNRSATCSQLILECLPAHVAATVPTWRAGWCSPNCLAKWSRQCGSSQYS